MDNESMQWLKEKLPLIEARVAEKVKAESGDTCLYRVNGRAWDLSPGNCCFVGVLIKPEEYSTEMESKNPCHMILSHRLVDWPEEAAYALGRLQLIHDRSPVESWDEEFQLWKEKYGLA